MKHALLAALILFSFPAHAATMLEGKKVCVVSGCSSQLCVDAQNDMASTCEWTDAYACYGKHSTCEIQPGGECGWTETEALKSCLANPPPPEGSAQ